MENTTPASQAAFRYRRSPTHCGSIPRRSSLKKPQSHSHDDDCDDVSHSNRQHQSGSESGSWSGSRSTTQKARGVQFPSAAHEEAYVIGQAAADYDRSPHQRHGRKKHHSGGAESESHFAKSSHVATQPYFWIFVIVGCYIVRCCALQHARAVEFARERECRAAAFALHFALRTSQIRYPFTTRARTCVLRPDTSG